MARMRGTNVKMSQEVAALHNFGHKIVVINN